MSLAGQVLWKRSVIGLWAREIIGNASPAVPTAPAAAPAMNLRRFASGAAEATLTFLSLMSSS